MSVRGPHLAQHPGPWPRASLNAALDDRALSCVFLPSVMLYQAHYFISSFQTVSLIIMLLVFGAGQVVCIRLEVTRTDSLVSETVESNSDRSWRWSTGRYVVTDVSLLALVLTSPSPSPLKVSNQRYRPRPHRQQCRSNVVECYKSNDSFDKVECCFNIVAVFGNNVERSQL